MEFKYVKIGEGGKVEIAADEFYNKEEIKMADEVCGIVNADLKLKKLFVSAVCNVLEEHVIAMVKAFNKRDKVAKTDATQKSVDLLKGLTMHMCVQVLLKRKEAS